MKRPRLKNKASKTDLPSKKQNYEKQGILITKLNKQIKKNISKILIIMQKADNKFPKSLNKFPKSFQNLINYATIWTGFRIT